MKYSILLIEDTKEIRENITEILTLKQYEVLYAANGKAGFDLAIRQKPDVILCDVLMPEMNGYEVLRAIKRNPTTTDIPFIFITSQCEKSDQQKALALGASAYFIKPFDTELLLECIESLLPTTIH